MVDKRAMRDTFVGIFAVIIVPMKKLIAGLVVAFLAVTGYLVAAGKVGSKAEVCPLQQAEAEGACCGGGQAPASAGGCAMEAAQSEAAGTCSMGCSQSAPATEGQAGEGK